MPQRPDFSERSLWSQAACGKASHQREEAVVASAPVDLSLGLAWQVCEGDQVVVIALRLQWRHNHDFGSRRPLSIPSNHASISRNALRWLLVSTILLFLAAKRFDKRTNRVSTDVADKHARYISEIAT